MQFLSATPLVKQFRNGSFEDAEVEPYFLANMVVTAITWCFAYEQADFWNIGSSMACVVITIFGILYLKEKNGGTFGNGFLVKYFSLGWVVAVRVLLLSIPAMVVLYALTSVLNTHDPSGPIAALSIISSEIAFFLWLGSLLAKANSLQEDHQNLSQHHSP